jgi:hypothetical protein
LCNRRASDVPAQPLELLSVATVQPLLGVHVDAPVLGDRLVGAGLGSLRRRLAEHQPQRRQSRPLAAHADALRGGSVAGGEPRLVEQELGRRLVTFRLEAPAGFLERSSGWTSPATARRATSSPRGLILALDPKRTKGPGQPGPSSFCEDVLNSLASTEPASSGTLAVHGQPRSASPIHDCRVRATRGLQQRPPRVPRRTDLRHGGGNARAWNLRRECDCPADCRAP